MLYFNTSQLHQSRKWYFFQKNRWFAGSLKMCWNIESKSVCWVTGIAAQRSGGCSKIPAFVPQLSTRYYCFSLHCASIVLLLCVRFCAHIAAAAQRAGPSRCCHSVPHQCRLLLMHSLQFTRFTYFSCNHCHGTFMKRKNLKYRKKTYHSTIIVSPATVAIKILEKFV